MSTDSGEWRWLLARGAVVARDADGAPLRMAGTEMDITQRKRIEQAARDDKERLRRAQIFANIGTWEWNVETGELYWSERIAPLFGYPAGDLETSYENFIAAVHPDDREAVQQAVQACVRNDKRYEIEHRVVWPDGTVRWLHESGAVLRDAQGKALQMLGVVQDIHVRKCAEIALAERERQLREAQELAGLGNWWVDLTTGEHYWSDEVYHIFGRSRSNFRPSVEGFFDAVHPEDRHLVMPEVPGKEGGLGIAVHDIVHRIVRPDGMVRHVHELAESETDSHGRTVRIRGTVQDITERKRSELALVESQAKLSGLFELSPLGIALTDMSGRLLEFNEAYRAITGYPAEELYQLDYWTLTPLEYHPQHEEQLDSIRNSRRYGPFEKSYLRKNGERVPVRLNGIEVRSQAGESLIWSIVEDISDRRRAERALIAARDEAQRANQAKSDFLSSMSHELRTPMNAILGFGQLMECDASLSAEHRDSTQEILKAGRHLLDLINEVLDLARVESGQIQLTMQELELKSVLDECLSLVSTQAGKRAIRLEAEDMRDTRVWADRTRLKQALLNLLSNAIKYSHEGGTVQVQLERPGPGRLWLAVIDNGPGIPAERLGELFQPFSRLGAERSGIEGTGIGLTITRRIVESMGGRVDVHSEPGLGSRFWIELPDIDAAGGRDEAPASPSQRGA